MYPPLLECHQNSLHRHTHTHAAQLLPCSDCGPEVSHIGCTPLVNALKVEKTTPGKPSFYDSKLKQQPSPQSTASSSSCSSSASLSKKSSVVTTPRQPVVDHQTPPRTSATAMKQGSSTPKLPPTPHAVQTPHSRKSKRQSLQTITNQLANSEGNEGETGGNCFEAPQHNSRSSEDHDVGLSSDEARQRRQRVQKLRKEEWQKKHQVRQTMCGKDIDERKEDREENRCGDRNDISDEADILLTDGETTVLDGP